MTDPRFDNHHLYKRYDVVIKLREKLCGGIPRDPNMIAAWVKAKTGFDDAQTKEQVEEVTEAMVDQAAEGSWIGFMSDDEGLYLEARNLKAMLRECASVLGILKKKRGSKQIIQHGFEVKAPGGSPRIRLGVKEPTGRDEKAIHVMTAQGQRNALKRVDYVEAPEVHFEVWVLHTAPAETRHIGEKELVEMLTLAQENGLGADRSQGAGKFDVVQFSVIE